MISNWLYPQHRYIQRCKEENNALDLKEKHVLIVGGTQGIGAAVARRFASLHCKVSIAGRSAARGKSVLWEANLANPGPLGKFYKVDLSSMKEVERFTEEVTRDTQKTGGIDYLVLCAGGPPIGRFRGPTYEGLEKSFAVQCMSRFYTTYRLLPVIKESVVVVASPGHGAFYDESDPGFEKPENRKKMNMIRQGRRDSLFLDAVFKEFSIRNPKITFHHIFPGLTQTNALENQGFHPTVVTLGRFFSGFIATDPDKYADVPVCRAASNGESGKGEGEVRRGLELSQQWGWKVRLERWAEDEEKRRALFEWALRRAEMAAKVPSPLEAITDISQPTQ